MICILQERQSFWKKESSRICIFDDDENSQECPYGDLLLNISEAQHLNDFVPPSQQRVLISVVGEIPVVLNGLSQISKEISITGYKSNSSVKINCIETFHSLNLTNITIKNSENKETINSNNILRITSKLTSINCIFEGIDSIETKELHTDEHSYNLLPSYKSEITHVLIYNQTQIKCFNPYIQIGFLSIYATKSVILDFVNIIGNTSKSILNYNFQKNTSFKYDIETNIQVFIYGESVSFLSIKCYDSQAKINVYGNYSANNLFDCNNGNIYVNTDYTPLNVKIPVLTYFYSEKELNFEKITINQYGIILTKSKRIHTNYLIIENSYIYLITDSSEINANYIVLNNNYAMALPNAFSKHWVISETTNCIFVYAGKYQYIEFNDINIRYVMGSVPYIKFNLYESQYINLDIKLLNYGSNYQIYTNDGWDDVYIDVINGLNTNNFNVSVKYIANSWIFNDTTREFDLIASENPNNKTSLSIVKKQKTIVDDNASDEKTVNIDHLLIIIIPIVLVTIFIATLIAIYIKKTIKKNKINHFMSAEVESDVREILAPLIS